jgi:hypothetical protein
MQLRGRFSSTPKKKRRGRKKNDEARIAPCLARFRPGLVGQLLLSLDPLDRRPPRDASPPFLPAILASSLVNSCAVPFWCAARPPFAAIARCAWGSIAANPRGVLRLTVPLLRVSTPSLRLPEIVPLLPLIPPLVLPPAPPETPLLRPLRSSILPSWLVAWSAIIDLLPRFSSVGSGGCSTSIT